MEIDQKLNLIFQNSFPNGMIKNENEFEEFFRELCFYRIISSEVIFDRNSIIYPLEKEHVINMLIKKFGSKELSKIYFKSHEILDKLKSVNEWLHRLESFGLTDENIIFIYSIKLALQKSILKARDNLDEFVSVYSYLNCYIQDKEFDDTSKEDLDCYRHIEYFNKKITRIE